jgi:hypothetical protein
MQTTPDEMLQEKQHQALLLSLKNFEHGKLEIIVITIIMLQRF